MKWSVFRMLLDLHDNVSGYELNVKVGDNYRIIYATISDGGEPYELDDNMTASMIIRTSSSTATATCIIGKGMISAQIPNTILANAGTYECEFQMSSGSGVDLKKVTTPSFRIVVNPTV